MEYIYAALLLHKVGQEINEKNVEKVLTAAGAKPESARVKALIASLDGVDIQEAINKAAVAPVAVAAAVSSSSEAPKTEKKEEKKEESKADDATGLGALFG